MWNGKNEFDICQIDTVRCLLDPIVQGSGLARTTKLVHCSLTTQIEEKKSMEQVRSLLKELNLDGKDYEEKLADQGFDSLAALCVSTEADLLECGLKKGHVRLLMKALATQTSGEKGKRDAGAVVANALQATKEEECEEPRPPPVSPHSPSEPFPCNQV